MIPYKYHCKQIEYNDTHTHNKIYISIILYYNAMHIIYIYIYMI